MSLSVAIIFATRNFTHDVLETKNLASDFWHWWHLRCQFLTCQSCTFRLPSVHDSVRNRDLL